MKKPLQLLAIMYLLFFGCSEKEGTKNKDLTKLVIEKNDDGSIKKIGYTLGGQKNGEWKNFNKNRLSSIISFKKGTEHGKAIWYDICSGTITIDGQYDMGKPIGLWYNYLYGELITVVNHKGNTVETVYEHPLFKAQGWPPPPPPPTGSIYDCDVYGEH